MAWQRNSGNRSNFGAGGSLPAPMSRPISKHPPHRSCGIELLMRNRIVAIAVGLQLLVAGACAVGWIAAHAEYCQYGDHIKVENCEAYELATLMIDAITWSVDTTLPMLNLIVAVAACVLTYTLHRSNETLKQSSPLRGGRLRRLIRPRSSIRL